MTDKDYQLFTIPEAAIYFPPDHKTSTSTATQSYRTKTKSVNCFYFLDSRMNELDMKFYNQIKNEKKYYNAFYGILAFAICVAGCSPATLIPMHNSVINPQFWYEVLISFLPLTFFIAAFSIMMR